MKKILTVLLSLALILGLSLPALAQTAPDDSATLVVSGTSTISLQADMATVELGTQTRGRTVGEAHQENARIMEAVIAALEGAGVVKEDISTSSYYVYFEPDGSMMGTVSNLISGSYVVTNMLFVTIHDVEKVSQAIDVASTAGANNIYSLTFQSSKSKDAYNQALASAVEDARSKAEVLAAATGKTLGSLVKADSNDLYATPYDASMREQYAGEMDKATPIVAGNVFVTANVVLTFNLD